jgi:prevent-host-death family protein
MTKVALTYAKAHFSELAERSARGEEIIVTRHDKPFVKLVPAVRPSHEDIKRLLAEMDEIRSGTRLGKDLSIAKLSNEGRR